MVLVHKLKNFWNYDSVLAPICMVSIELITAGLIYNDFWATYQKRGGFASQKTLTLTGLLATGWLNSKMNGKRPLWFGRFGPPSHKSYNPKCTIYSKLNALELPNWAQWIIFFKFQINYFGTQDNAAVMPFWMEIPMDWKREDVELFFSGNRVTQLKNKRKMITFP